MYSFENDPSGMLLVETSGFWTVAEAENYQRELASQLERRRRMYGYSLAFIDGRHTEVQPPEVMARLADLQSFLVVGERDRAAYVVANSLAKMQAQRLATTDQLKVFLSPSAARTWLLAYEPAGGTEPTEV